MNKTARPRLEVLEDRCVPASFTYTGPNGGDWFDKNNWNSGTATKAPGVTDDVTIRAGIVSISGGKLAEIDTLSMTAGGINVNGTDPVTGDPSVLKIDGRVQVSGGSLHLDLPSNDIQFDGGIVSWDNVDLGDATTRGACYIYNNASLVLANDVANIRAALMIGTDPQGDFSAGKMVDANSAGNGVTDTTVYQDIWISDSGTLALADDGANTTAGLSGATLQTTIINYGTITRFTPIAGGTASGYQHCYLGVDNYGSIELSGAPDNNHWGASVLFGGDYNNYSVYNNGGKFEMDLNTNVAFSYGYYQTGTGSQFIVSGDNAPADVTAEYVWGNLNIGGGSLLVGEGGATDFTKLNLEPWESQNGDLIVNQQAGGSLPTVGFTVDASGRASSITCGNFTIGANAAIQVWTNGAPAAGTTSVNLITVGWGNGDGGTLNIDPATRLTWAGPGGNCWGGVLQQNGDAVWLHA